MCDEYKAITGWVCRWTGNLWCALGNRVQVGVVRSGRDGSQGIALGVLIGFLASMLLCARESTNIGPRPLRIERQLEILKAEMRLDAPRRLAALGEPREDRPGPRHSREMSVLGMAG